MSQYQMLKVRRLYPLNEMPLPRKKPYFHFCNLQCQCTNKKFLQHHFDRNPKQSAILVSDGNTDPLGKCTAIGFLKRIHNLALWAFSSNGGLQGRDSNLNNETVRAIEARDEDVDYVLFVLLRRTSKPRSLLLPLTATAPLRRLISRPSVSRKL